MLAPVLNNNFAPIAFAIALIAAGQSSTVTGTLAGQIVMEGYLNIKINPFIRQLITGYWLLFHLFWLSLSMEMTNLNLYWYSLR